MVRAGCNATNGMYGQTGTVQQLFPLLGEEPAALTPLSQNQPRMGTA